MTASSGSSSNSSDSGQSSGFSGGILSGSQTFSDCLTTVVTPPPAESGPDAVDSVSAFHVQTSSASVTDAAGNQHQSGTSSTAEVPGSIPDAYVRDGSVQEFSSCVNFTSHDPPQSGHSPGSEMATSSYSGETGGLGVSHGSSHGSSSSSENSMTAAKSGELETSGSHSASSAHSQDDVDDDL